MIKQKNGPAAHINREDKMRVLPTLPSDSSTEYVFAEQVANSVPNFYVYLGNGVGTDLSRLGDFIHYHNLNLRGSKELDIPANPIYFKRIVEDENLLNSKRKKFTQSDLISKIFDNIQTDDKQIKSID